MSVFTILSLKNSTGCGVKECKSALRACNGNDRIAYEYLRLRNSAVARYKLVGSEKVKWSESDYVAEARRRYFASIESV